MFHNNEPEPSRKNVPRATWVFLGFAALAGFFLFTEHRAHVLGVLPYALVVLCPLLHIFAHRGHQRSQQDQHGDGRGHARHNGPGGDSP